MSGETRTKNVSCSICGKKGQVSIRKSDGKIIGNDFIYYGKIDVNGLKTSKYVYAVETHDGKIILDKNGRMKFTKMKNKLYDKDAKHKYVDYFECKKCCNEG